MLSFLSVSGSTLPDPLVRGMDPDENQDPSMRLLHKSEYTTLSRPQQHSHSHEKVLVNSLLQAKRVLVDCRGLESVSRGRESVDRGLEMS